VCQRYNWGDNEHGEQDKKLFLSQTQWFMLVILATQEVEIESVVVQSQPSQKVSKTPSQPKSWV
jgi:hypothetical protein